MHRMGKIVSLYAVWYNSSMPVSLYMITWCACLGICFDWKKAYFHNMFNTKYTRLEDDKYRTDMQEKKKQSSMQLQARFFFASNTRWFINTHQQVQHPEKNPMQNPEQKTMSKQFDVLQHLENKMLTEVVLKRFDKACVKVDHCMGISRRNWNILTSDEEPIHGSETDFLADRQQVVLVDGEKYYEAIVTLWVHQSPDLFFFYINAIAEIMNATVRLHDGNVPVVPAWPTFHTPLARPAWTPAALNQPLCSMLPVNKSC